MSDSEEDDHDTYGPEEERPRNQIISTTQLPNDVDTKVVLTKDRHSIPKISTWMKTNCVEIDNNIFCS
ncbi:hypothetical protein PsorP6_014575 [Peronosclerospora sorghi]|uniref:Uncharacterized protein n=1 Tax=Peronosclerospora sorghi TaxID=230839 RepID=A0ACC0VSY1_9STRA|nr:hypothetical protein PsorP6_014575 [Peronosclerospora sorghi]